MKRKRIKYEPKICMAVGCTNVFEPLRKGHKYCSEACATYMRVKRHRRKNGN